MELRTLDRMASAAANAALGALGDALDEAEAAERDVGSDGPVVYDDREQGCVGGVILASRSRGGGPAGPEGLSLAITRNCPSDGRVLSPHRLRAEPPRRGGQGVCRIVHAGRPVLWPPHLILFPARRIASYF